MAVCKQRLSNLAHMSAAACQAVRQFEHLLKHRRTHNPGLVLFYPALDVSLLQVQLCEVVLELLLALQVLFQLC